MKSANNLRSCPPCEECTMRPCRMTMLKKYRAQETTTILGANWQRSSKKTQQCFKRKNYHHRRREMTRMAIFAMLSYFIAIDCCCVEQAHAILQESTTMSSQKSKQSKKQPQQQQPQQQQRHKRACHFLKSTLKSLARVAQRGASTFTDYYYSPPSSSSGNDHPILVRRSASPESSSSSSRNRFQRFMNDRNNQFQNNNGDSFRQPSDIINNDFRENNSFVSSNNANGDRMKGFIPRHDNLNYHQQEQQQQPHYNTKEESNNNSNIKSQRNTKYHRINTIMGEQYSPSTPTSSTEVESNTDPPYNHFLEDTLAYIAGGAAASSAFAAITAGALFATAVVAVGAVASALLMDMEEEKANKLLDDLWVEEEEEEGYHDEYYSDNYEYGGEYDEDCEYDANAALVNEWETLEGTFEKRDYAKSPSQQKHPPLRHTTKFDEITMEELKKCFYGKLVVVQNNKSSPFELSQLQWNDVCRVDDGDDVKTSSELLDIVPSDDLVRKPTCGAAHETTNFHLKDSSMNNDAIPQSQFESNNDPMEPIRKRVEVVWHDAYTAAANTYYYTKEEEKNTNSNKRAKRIRNNRQPRQITKSQSALQPNDDEHWTIYTDAERDGALLLSESFRVASSTFGLVADAVRFTGETAAAAAGGTARLAGGLVRVSGWAVESLGSAIEKGTDADDNTGGNKQQLKLPLSTPAKGLDSKRGQKGNLGRNTRKVAGTSVRLVGDAIGQVADSLLFAGSATERVAFAAAGAAEGTVRIVEELASAISDMFAREGQRGLALSSSMGMGAEILEDIMKDVEELESDEKTSDDSLLGFNDDDMRDVSGATIDESAQDDGTYNDALIGLAGVFYAWAIQNAEFIMKDTMGVAAIAPELLGVLLICYLASIVLLSSGRRMDETPKEPNMIDIGKVVGAKKDQQRPTSVDIHTGNLGRNAKESSLHNTKATDHNIDDDSTLTVDSTMKVEPEFHRGTVKSQPGSFLRRMIDFFFATVALPFKLSRWIFTACWSILFSRKILLLVIYLAGWLFLCRVSQYRSSTIQRKSELSGFKSAVDSIGNSSPSIPETAVWLNSIFAKIWRFGATGGLESLLSSHASASLITLLEDSYSKPSGVAHVMLESFTFGSSPPVVRSIEMKGVNDKEAVVYLGVDVGMLFDDANIMLDIKPSSLEYKALPSTRVSINSLSATVSLEISIKGSAQYPYISFVNLSLSNVPEFNLRIVPQNESGLKGVDFGSFPVVSKWVKETINAALAEYVTPQYLAINIPSWLRGEDDIVKYFKS